MLRIARAALFIVLPAELLLVVVLVSGVALPGLVIAAAETAVVLVLIRRRWPRTGCSGLIG